MPEINAGRDLRARSVKLISYPIGFLMRWRTIVKFLLHACRQIARRSPGMLILQAGAMR